MRWLDGWLQRWRSSVARRWVPRGARVLDVGCHHGEFFRALGPRLGSGLGIDPLAAPASGPRWTITQDRFPPTVPLPPASFDAIVLLATLEHIRDKDVFIEECFRVLRPGGRAIVTVPSTLVDPIVLALARLGLADGMSLDEHHGFDPSETRRLFVRHGFELVRWEEFQLGLNNLFVFATPATNAPASTPAPDGRH